MTQSLNRAPGPVFPIEVFEHIIDMIAESRFPYHKERVRILHACVLVARSWVPRSRIHLYGHIGLDSDLRTTQFLDSVTKSPALGEYVRFLLISPRFGETEISGGWIFRAISILPPLLPHLYELALWDIPVLHPVYIAVLSRFRTIESLELVGIKRRSLQEIVQLINRFPRLRRLCLWECGWKTPGRYYYGKQHNLSTLEMRYNNLLDSKPLLEWDLESKSTCVLTAFRSDSDVTGSTLDHILQSCCSTLRELHLDVYGDEGEWFCMLFFFRVLTIAPDAEVEIPLLTDHLALQRLAFHGYPEPVISVLARLPLFAPSSLVCVSYNSFFRSDEPHLTKDVDLALCDSKFPHLTSVQLSGTHLMDEKSHPQPINDPHTFFQRTLPKSYKRGILWYRGDYQSMYFILIMLPHSDLCRAVYSHHPSGCPTIPRTTS